MKRSSRIFLSVNEQVALGDRQSFWALTTGSFWREKLSKVPPLQVAAPDGNMTTYPTFLSSREIHNNSQVSNEEKVKQKEGCSAAGRMRKKGTEGGGGWANGVKEAHCCSVWFFPSSAGLRLHCHTFSTVSYTALELFSRNSRNFQLAPKEDGTTNFAHDSKYNKFGKLWTFKGKKWCNPLITFPC